MNRQFSKWVSTTTVLVGLSVMVIGCCSNSDKGEGGDEVSALIEKALAGDLESCGLDHGAAMAAFGARAYPAISKAYDSAETYNQKACILDLADSSVGVTNGTIGHAARLACHAISAEVSRSSKERSTTVVTHAMQLAGGVVAIGARANSAPWSELEACRDSLKKITDSDEYTSIQLDRAKSLLDSLDCECAR